MNLGSPVRAPLVAPALVVAVLAISFAALFFKKAAPTHPVVAAGIRLAVATVLLLPFALRSLRAGRGSARLLRAGAVAGVLYGVHFGTWVTSLTLTSVAASVTLVTATPLLLAVVALVTGKDRPDRRMWVALALALTGVLWIGGSDLSIGPDALAGDALALAGAGAMAGYLLLARRLGAAMDVWIFSAVACCGGALTMLVTALALDVSLAPASSEAFLYLVLAALIPQLVGHTLLTWALRFATPTAIGIATVGEPAGAAFLSWIWLGETVSPTIAFGCAITMAAVILAVARPKRTPGDPSPSSTTM